METARDLLRHTLATLAYRSAKVLRDAPESFSSFKAGPETRTPGEIVAHLNDLMEWGLSMAKGAPAWKPSAVLDWRENVERYFAALAAFDSYLASGAELHAPAE